MIMRTTNVIATVAVFALPASARAIAQYDSLRARVLTDMLASFELQPGTVAFVGYGSLFEQRDYLNDAWIPGAGGLP